MERLGVEYEEVYRELEEIINDIETTGSIWDEVNDAIQEQAAQGRI